MPAPAGARHPQVTRRAALFGGNDDAHLLEPGQLLGGAELVHTQTTRLAIAPVKGNAELCQHALQRAILPGAAMEGQEDILLGAEKRFERHMGRCKIGLMQEMRWQRQPYRALRSKPASRPASASARQAATISSTVWLRSSAYGTRHAPAVYIEEGHRLKLLRAP